MQKITGLINTFNEENNIKGCLNSILWMDEIILIDTGSTDNTIKIAKKYHIKIIKKNKIEFVEQIRNESIELAKYEWVFIIDADERLPSGSEKIIRKLITSKNTSGYLFPRRNYINKNYFLKNGFFYPDYQFRLFNKKFGEIKYSGKIHEQPNQINLKVIKLKSIYIIHNDSHSKYNSFKSIKKTFNYIKFESREMLNNKINYLKLIDSITIGLFRDIYRSLIKLEGYKDGFYGFRAAIIYSIYRYLINMLFIKYKIENLSR